MKHLHVLAAGVAAIVAVLPGCSSPDERVAEMARQATHEQAQQNQRIAEGSKAVAEGSKQLVEADANARRELIDLQQDLREDQAEVGRRRDDLEEERRAIAGQRLLESRGGALCVALAILLMCLAPLVLAGISLQGLWRAPTPEEQGQVLVEELVQALGQDLPQGTGSLPAEDPSAPRLSLGPRTPDP